ncbi:MAG TPA: helix-turn-helix domain-containing protein [Gemmataceae bacterium]
MGLIWLVMFRRANAKTRLAYASLNSLAEVTGLSRRWCITAVRELLRRDLIRRHEDKKGWFYVRHLVDE